MDNKNGVAAMMELALRLETEHSMETLNIGRSSPVLDDCLLETTSRWLSYEIVLTADEVRLNVGLMDSVDPPQMILRVRDEAPGWDVMRRLIGSLEKYEVRDLTRPIQSGPIGNADSWIIA